MGKKIAGQYRQGDVFITRVDEVPKALKKVERDAGRVILAYGEVTGHAHAIEEQAATLYSETGVERPEGMYLEVPFQGGTTLKHEEHGTITLPPGNYHVRRQREYHPEKVRFVAD